ncbi:hypothetical protein EVAR_51955_1 [Eumeta japonica]|uniref:Uncharacterized protein n=1 Tax=Eumeta variegata TaxID=151549 RepID=A0A4C1Y4N9_EUMVA|nr:hypothetical protein EVAR_51955_1 [Eumeta japonica]
MYYGNGQELSAVIESRSEPAATSGAETGLLLIGRDEGGGRRGRGARARCARADCDGRRAQSGRGALVRAASDNEIVDISVHVQVADGRCFSSARTHRPMEWKRDRCAIGRSSLSIEPRSRSHALLRRNATMTHAISLSRLWSHSLSLAGGASVSARPMRRIDAKCLLLLAAEAASMSSWS